jgi:hypothetical protein
MTSVVNVELAYEITGQRKILVQMLNDEAS